MCGIFGWQFKSDKIGTVSRFRMNVLTGILAKEMSERGKHSHGSLAWYGDSATTTPKIYKKVGHILGSDEMLASLARASQCVVHTRAATCGAITKENCHPFTAIAKVETAALSNGMAAGERIIHGVHNGIINNHEELGKKYNREFEVDSQHIFQHLVEDRSLREIQGYGAVVYYDSPDPTRLYMGTFNRGSLEVFRLYDEPPEKKWTFAEECDRSIGVLWASTKWAINKALEHASLWGSSVNLRDEKLYFAENGAPFEAIRHFVFGVRGGSSNGPSYSWERHRNTSSSSSPSNNTKAKDDKEITVPFVLSPRSDHGTDSGVESGVFNPEAFDPDEWEQVGNGLVFIGPNCRNRCGNKRNYWHNNTLEKLCMSCYDKQGRREELDLKLQSITSEPDPDAEDITQHDILGVPEGITLELIRTPKDLKKIRSIAKKARRGKQLDERFEKWLIDLELREKGGGTCVDCDCSLNVHTDKNSFCSKCGAQCESALNHKNFVEGVVPSTYC
jgi:hypothetical protein